MVTLTFISRSQKIKKGVTRVWDAPFHQKWNESVERSRRSLLTDRYTHTKRALRYYDRDMRSKRNSFHVNCLFGTIKCRFCTFTNQKLRAFSVKLIWSHLIYYIYLVFIVRLFTNKTNITGAYKEEDNNCKSWNVKILNTMLNRSTITSLNSMRHSLMCVISMCLSSNVAQCIGPPSLLYPIHGPNILIMKC